MIDSNFIRSCEIAVFSRWNLKKIEANQIIIIRVMNKTISWNYQKPSNTSLTTQPEVHGGHLLQLNGPWKMGISQWNRSKCHIYLWCNNIQYRLLMAICICILNIQVAGYLSLRQRKGVSLFGPKHISVTSRGS